MYVCKERVKKGISQHCHSRRIFIFFYVFFFQLYKNKKYTVSWGTLFYYKFYEQNFTSIHRHPIYMHAFISICIQIRSLVFCKSPHIHIEKCLRPCILVQLNIQPSWLTCNSTQPSVLCCNLVVGGYRLQKRFEVYKAFFLFPSYFVEKLDDSH